jgi:dihydroneopterin aldolase
MIIQLNDLRFFSFHGLFAEERKTGNLFILDVAVHYPDEKFIAGLEDTIDYASLYSLIRVEMEKPRDLMETLCLEICEVIHQSWKNVSRVDIAIKKVQPPIPGFTGSAGITLTKEF